MSDILKGSFAAFEMPGTLVRDDDVKVDTQEWIRPAV